MIKTPELRTLNCYFFINFLFKKYSTVDIRLLCLNDNYFDHFIYFILLLVGGGGVQTHYVTFIIGAVCCTSDS